LPALDVRAEALLSGHTPPANSLHPLYIGAEALKLLLLLGTAVLAFRAQRLPAAVAAEPRPLQAA